MSLELKLQQIVIEQAIFSVKLKLLDVVSAATTGISRHVTFWGHRQICMDNCNSCRSLLGNWAVYTIAYHRDLRFEKFPYNRSPLTMTASPNPP